MRNGKVTLCITTGEIFVSAKHAAAKCNIPYASLSKVCEGKQKSYNGMEFCYMEDAPLKVTKIAAVVRAKNTRAMQRELELAQKRMEKARAAKTIADAELAAAEAKYNEIAAQIAQ